VTDRLLLVGSDTVPQGYLYALERSTGAVLWKHPFPGGVGATVLRRGDTAFALSASGEVVAVDIGSGKIAWRTPPSDLAGDRLLDPVLAGDRLFVGWRAGYVDALETATGRRIWRTQLGARLNTSLAIAGSTLVVGALDGNLYSLSRTDGSVLSKRELKGMPYGDLVEGGECLLALSRATDDSSPQAGPYSLSCLDPSLSKTSWSYRSKGELSTFRPLVHQGRAIVGSEGSLTALDLGTGSEAWSCPLKGVPRGLGASGEIVYVGTLSGQVLALDPARCAGPR
jgi:outer membrane protein assembly factor BamB